ncbi:MAG TPA: mechanosensitive ion channel family protein [Longimicrobiales bacterium]
MIQQPDSVVQTIADFDWREALQWEVLVRIAIVVVVGILTYRIVKILIRRLLQREIEEEDPLVRRLREQRSQTIASLLASVALVTISVVVILTILNILLDDIGPILASFGILGLAFSFGAQSLVKDVISGTFMLIEGQFAIGDVVRIGDTAGAVERITLRTTVLRDLHGNVHIIPNGEITRVTNMTKAWSRAVLNIGVAYKEDVDRVIEVLRDIGTGFHGDPEWSALLLEEPVVLGIDDFADSAVVIRMMAKTLPLKQWEVARELRRRIKRRFDREGIEIPFPHTTVYWGEGQAPAPRANDDPTMPHDAAAPL